MIFETLWESAQRGELMLIEGGFCHFHLRRDGQVGSPNILSKYQFGEPGRILVEVVMYRHPFITGKRRLLGTEQVAYE